MNPDQVPSPPAIGRAQHFATRIAFFISGFGFAAWAPIVPYAKLRTGLGEGELGLLLLCLGLGSLLTMPLTGALAGRFGCRAVIVVATLVLVAVLPLLATLASPWALALALFFFGGSIGTIDVAMNIQAVAIEKARARSLMPEFHGLFSLGTMLGAIGVSQMLAWLGDPRIALGCVAGIVLLMIAGVGRWLLPERAAPGTPLFVLPRGGVVLIGVLCFIVFMLEGAILDWSALFLTEHKGLAPERGGLGYAGFAVAMTVIRLSGEGIVRRLGSLRVMILGALCCTAGFWLAVASSSALGSIIGFTLAGIGAANIGPVLFSFAGAQRQMPAPAAIAAITTMGYAGILAGPAAIGLVAELIGLSAALAGVGLAVLLIVLAAPRVARAAE